MIVYVVGTCVKFLISTIWALQHKNTQILENVLYLDPTFKMLKNTSFATHKYMKIPPPHNLCLFCVFRSPDGTSWKFYTCPHNIINSENAYAELANLLSLAALDIFIEKYQQFINQPTDFA